MKPNILLIVVDSFHAEKFYGNRKTSITPNIDSLIKQGTYFSQAITCAPSTLPSLGSIFTSCYPFESTIRDKKNFIFNSQIPNYLNHLKNVGYTTYAFIPEIINHYGFGKLFDKINTYKPNRSLYHGDGDTIVNQLTSNEMNKPWFYYFHSLDLHGYKKFDENEKLKKFHNEKYGINKYEQMVSALDVWIGKIVNAVNIENTIIILTADHATDDANYTKKLQKYKKNVRSYKPSLIVNTLTELGQKTPSFLSPLKAKFRKKFVKRRTKILSKKADEELATIKTLDLSPYEKRIMENAVKTTYHIFDDRLKIPLFFVGPKIPANKIITNQVQSIDIFPTIAEIIGLSPHDDVRGKSLLPLINGNKINELPAFIESATNHVDILTADVIGLRTPRFKYFRDRNDAQSNVNLFNLEDDPLEEKNIATENPSIVKKMEESLMEINHDGVFEFQQCEKLTDDDEQTKLITKELKKLGYI